MKRKCYALLALLLAVCMVLPMGVFVGAADTKEPEMKIEVSGNIGSDGKVTTKSEDYTNKSIDLAMNGTANVTVTVPDGYTVTVSGEGKGVTGITGSGSSYQIYALSTKLGNSDKYTFTATKKGVDKPLTATLGVNVKDRKILYVAITADVDGKNMLLEDNVSFTPGQTVTVKTVQFFYNDGTDSTSLAKVTPDKVTVTGGMDKLSFDVTDTDGLSITAIYKIFVLGKTIESITVDDVTKPAEYKDGTANIQNDITVRATYTDGKTVILNPEDYTITLYDGDKVVSGPITKDNYKNLSFTITYDGYTTAEKFNVAKYITYSNAKPTDLTMTFGKNTKKDWVEGQTFNDFNDVTVTITYDDGNTATVTNSDIAKLNLSISKFVYGDNYITVEYTESGKTISKKVSTNGLTISKKLVDHLEITAKPKKTDYTEGDKLDLDGMEISLIYNNDEKEALPYSYSKFSCSPANGSVLSAGTTTVYVIYKDSYVDSNGKTQSIEKSVNMALSVKKAGKKLNSADLAWGSNGKTEYFVGETFKPAGFRVTLFFNDGTKETLALDSSKLTVTYSVENGDFKSASSVPSFTKAQNAYVIAKIKYGSYADAVELQIPVSVTKRPNLKAITAVCTKTNDDGQREGYFVGDVPSVRDFEITVYYDDNSTRSFIVDKEETVNARTPYNFTRKEDGVTYTVKLTPTKIEEDTKKITVSYNEYVTIGTRTNKTVETEVEVKVTVPDCILKHYTSTRNYETKAYESLYDALVDATDTYYDEIQLCRDVTMSTDYASDKTLEIDLNGHTLTMVRGEICVRSSASSSTKITFTNSSRDDAHIRYTNNEDDDVIVAYNKEYVIDRNSKGDGRYDVTITSVKNGKVTGPTEVIHGHDAKFTITPDEGYEIAAIKVNSKTYKAASDNTLLIEDVREKLTVTVTFQEKAWQNPFTDVSKYATYYKAVQFVYEEGLFNGTSATKFEPDTTMTRAMFVTVLGRLAGVNVDNYKTSSFSDVATGQWYSEYVEWASSIGLVEGYGNGKFGPNDSITHAQMYVLMERYADIIEGKTTTASGTSISANDVRDIPDWAYEAVEYAAKKDFLVVSSYKLTPNDNAKRSELAMLLQKFCKNVLEY